MDDIVFYTVEITQSIIDGVLFGSTYSLIGIGFTLIFGAMHKLNMTYAAASLAGAYIGLVFFTLFDAPAMLVFLAAIVGSAGIGLIVYYICFRYIRTTMELK